MNGEGCGNELYYFRSLQIYAQDAKRKASFLVDDLDKIVSGTKEPHVYALQQLAKDLKQYADDALKIAGDIVTVYEQERCTKHELAHLTRKEVLDGLERIHELTLSIWPRKSISIYHAFLEIENIAKRLLDKEQSE